MKALVWFISVIGALTVAGSAFVYFSPDYAVYSVGSESMDPAIKMGDMLVSGPLNGPFSGELKPGAVVTYERGSNLVTHRVVSVDGDTLVTKGDAMESLTHGQSPCLMLEEFNYSIFPTEGTSPILYEPSKAGF